MAEALHRYYRSTNTEVVAAVTAYFTERDALHKIARKFVKRFGGTDALWWMMFGYSFAGMVFTKDKPPKDEHLWTKPSKSGERHPKATGGADAGAALRAEWKKHWPEGTVRDDKWLAALGLKQGVRRPGIAMLKDRPNVVYIHTNEPVTVADTVEITATQYEKETKDD